MYAKLFSSVIFSSIWAENPSTKVLFITMLAMADREGFIYASLNGLARAACLEPDETAAGLDVLTKPDTESSDLTRNPENEGRRVERIDGGWRIINYSYYRDLQDADERRYQDKMRKRKSRSVTVSHDPSRSVTENPPSESPSYSESESVRPPLPPRGGRRKGSVEVNAGKVPDQPKTRAEVKMIELSKSCKTMDEAHAEFAKWKAEVGDEYALGVEP